MLLRRRLLFHWADKLSIRRLGFRLRVWFLPLADVRSEAHFLILFELLFLCYFMPIKNVEANQVHGVTEQHGLNMLVEGT